MKVYHKATIIILLEESYNYSKWVCELFSKVVGACSLRCLIAIDLGDVPAISEGKKHDTKLLWERLVVSLPPGAASVRNCHLGKRLAPLSQVGDRGKCMRPRE